MVKGVACGVWVGWCAGVRGRVPWTLEEIRQSFGSKRASSKLSSLKSITWFIMNLKKSRLELEPMQRNGHGFSKAVGSTTTSLPHLPVP